MKPQTVVIIIVVVVLVLAASSWGIACSNRDESAGPSDPMPTWVEGFQGAFVRRRALPLGDLQCRLLNGNNVGSISGGSLVVNFSQTVRCTVGRSEGRKRVLAVTRQSGAVAFTGEVFGTRVTHESIDAESDNRAELVFETEGAEFDLSCGGSCSVRMSPVDD